MTGFAIDSLMFALQLKIGFVVVEMIHAFHDVERFFTVALAAILAKLVLMHISVAAGTIGVWDPLEFLEFLAVLCGDLMAFTAFNRRVFGDKRKI